MIDPCASYRNKVMQRFVIAVEHFYLTNFGSMIFAEYFFAEPIKIKMVLFAKKLD